MRSRYTIVNALIGAVVGVVLSFLPASPILGGVATGFLEGSDGRDGALAGTLAGLIMFVPIGLFAVAALGVFGVSAGLAGFPLEGLVLLGFVLVFGVTVVFVYTVGLAALGGYLGSYLAREYPSRRVSTRETIGVGASETERRPRTDTERGSRPEPTSERESPPDQSSDPDPDPDPNDDRLEQ